MKRPPNNEFRMGDVVSFGGVKGMIYTTTSSNPEKPLQALFAKEKLIVGFNADGRFLDWHNAPLLEFVKRPSPTLWSKLKQKFKKKSVIIENTTAETAPEEAVKDEQQAS